jgi:hypothetical protein
MIRAAKNLFREDSTALAIQINDNVTSGATRGAHHAATDVGGDFRTAHVWLVQDCHDLLSGDWTP